MAALADVVLPRQQLEEGFSFGVFSKTIKKVEESPKKNSVSDLRIGNPFFFSLKSYQKEN